MVMLDITSIPENGRKIITNINSFMEQHITEPTAVWVTQGNSGGQQI